MENTEDEIKELLAQWALVFAPTPAKGATASTIMQLAKQAIEGMQDVALAQQLNDVYAKMPAILWYGLHRVPDVIVERWRPMAKALLFLYKDAATQKPIPIGKVKKTASSQKQVAARQRFAKAMNPLLERYAGIAAQMPAPVDAPVDANQQEFALVDAPVVGVNLDSDLLASPVHPSRYDDPYGLLGNDDEAPAIVSDVPDNVARQQTSNIFQSPVSHHNDDAHSLYDDSAPLLPGTPVLRLDNNAAPVHATSAVQSANNPMALLFGDAPLAASAPQSAIEPFRLFDPPAAAASISFDSPVLNDPMPTGHAQWSLDAAPDHTLAQAIRGLESEDAARRELRDRAEAAEEAVRRVQAEAAQRVAEANQELRSRVEAAEEEMRRVQAEAAQRVAEAEQRVVNRERFERVSAESILDKVRAARDSVPKRSASTALDDSHMRHRRRHSDEHEDVAGIPSYKLMSSWRRKTDQEIQEAEMRGVVKMQAHQEYVELCTRLGFRVRLDVQEPFTREDVARAVDDVQRLSRAYDAYVGLCADQGVPVRLQRDPDTSEEDVARAVEDVGMPSGMGAPRWLLYKQNVEGNVAVEANTDDDDETESDDEADVSRFLNFMAPRDSYSVELQDTRETRRRIWNEFENQMLKADGVVDLTFPGKRKFNRLFQRHVELWSHVRRIAVENITFDEAYQKLRSNVPRAYPNTWVARVLLRMRRLLHSRAEDTDGDKAAHDRILDAKPTVVKCSACKAANPTLACMQCRNRYTGMCCSAACLTKHQRDLCVARK